MSTIPHDEELVWLRSVLGGEGSGPSVPYLCRPSAADPQLLLPLAPRASASASLRRHHDARTWRQRVESRVGRAGARLGRLQLGGGEVVHLAPFAVIEELSRRLGEERIVAAITLGPHRRNRKPVVQLLRPDGEMVGYAKIGWSPLTRRLVGTEADFLSRLDGRLPRTVLAPHALLTLRQTVPLATATPAAATTGSGTEVVISVATPLDPRRLRGANLATRPLPSSWVLDLAACLGTQTETVATIAARVVADLAEDLAADDEGAVDGLAEVSAAADRLTTTHGATELTTGLWHGDLTPWNTVTGRDQALIWDWEFAAAGRPIGLDLLHGTFESVRRRGVGHEAAAIEAARQAAPDALAPIGLDAATAEVVADLHLLELLAREHRLAAGGELPDGMGDLRIPLRGRLLDERA